jgi:hypothetical protein
MPCRAQRRNRRRCSALLALAPGPDQEGWRVALALRRWRSCRSRCRSALVWVAPVFIMRTMTAVASRRLCSRLGARAARAVALAGARRAAVIVFQLIVMDIHRPRGGAHAGLVRNRALARSALSARRYRLRLSERRARCRSIMRARHEAEAAQPRVPTPVPRSVSAAGIRPAAAASSRFRAIASAPSRAAPRRRQCRRSGCCASAPGPMTRATSFSRN